MMIFGSVKTTTATMTAPLMGLLILIGMVYASPQFSIDVSKVSPISDHRHLSNRLLLPRRDFIRDVMAIRGGQSADPYQQHSYYANTDSSENSASYENGFANYDPPPSTGYDDDREASMMQQSVQDRHDQWRSAQMERYANLTPEQELNPRDEQGRMKLMSSVSKGSRAFMFFILMWRDVYLFEVTDQSVKGSMRKMIIRGFLTVVFLGNLAGVITSVTAQGHSSKNRLKSILNLDKVVETSLLVWNLFRVSLFPSKYVPREVFVAGVLHSIFFLIQCQAFTRMGWDERVAPGLQQKQQIRREDLHQRPNEYYATTNSGL